MDQGSFEKIGDSRIDTGNYRLLEVTRKKKKNSHLNTMNCQIMNKKIKQSA